MGRCVAFGPNPTSGHTRDTDKNAKRIHKRANTDELNNRSRFRPTQSVLSATDARGQDQKVTMKVTSSRPRTPEPTRRGRLRRGRPLRIQPCCPPAPLSRSQTPGRERLPASARRRSARDEGTRCRRVTAFKNERTVRKSPRNRKKVPPFLNTGTYMLV